MKKIILTILIAGLVIALAPYIIMLILAIMFPGAIILFALYISIKMFLEPFRLFF